MDGLKTLMKSPRMQGYSGLQYRLIALCQSPRQNASPRSRYDTPSGNMVERVAHAPAAPRAMATMRQAVQSDQIRRGTLALEVKVAGFKLKPVSVTEGVMGLTEDNKIQAQMPLYWLFGSDI